MRSKTLFAANVLATLYSVYLLWTIGAGITAAGGLEYVEALGDYFALVFELIGTSSDTVVILYVILILLCVHIAVFTLGSLIGWIAFAGKKSGGAKFAATLYLFGSICFPVYIFISLPIAIVGFVGGGKQKKINKANA